jgi:bifunctional DNA-binding transcriptional regulator/antitoxin component of YhaV-PrlF toxin-antitoxin module
VCLPTHVPPDDVTVPAGDVDPVTQLRRLAYRTAEQGGLQAVPKKRSLVIPASARRTCGIRMGDSVLLAAAAELDIVLVHPPSVLDKMMALYHNELSLLSVRTSRLWPRQSVRAHARRTCRTGTGS